MQLQTASSDGYQLLKASEQLVPGVGLRDALVKKEEGSP